MLPPSVLAMPVPPAPPAPDVSVLVDWAPPVPSVVLELDDELMVLPIGMPVLDEVEVLVVVAPVVVTLLVFVVLVFVVVPVVVLLVVTVFTVAVIVTPLSEVCVEVGALGSASELQPGAAKTSRHASAQKPVDERSLEDRVERVEGARGMYDVNWQPRGLKCGVQ